jgi:hypothetical protein
VDGESVTDEPSQSDREDKRGGDEAVTATPFTDIFVQTFPSYMAIGMTYDEFWHGPAILVKYYREAYRIKRREEEWKRWRQGAYFYDALLRVAPVMRAAFGKGKVEPGKYPEEPWPLTQKEADEREQRRELENTKRFIAHLEAESERNLKKMKEASEDGGD